MATDTTYYWKIVTKKNPQAAFVTETLVHHFQISNMEE